MSRGRAMVWLGDILPLDFDGAGLLMQVYVSDAPFDLSGQERRVVITDYPVSQLRLTGASHEQGVGVTAERPPKPT